MQEHHAQRTPAGQVPSPRIGRMLGSEARLAANDEGELNEADLRAIDEEFGIDHPEASAAAADAVVNEAKASPRWMRDYIEQRAWEREMRRQELPR